MIYLRDMCSCRVGDANHCSKEVRNILNVWNATTTTCGSGVYTQRSIFIRISSTPKPDGRNYVGVPYSPTLHITHGQPHWPRRSQRSYTKLSYAGGVMSLRLYLKFNYYTLWVLHHAGTSIPWFLAAGSPFSYRI